MVMPRIFYSSFCVVLLSGAFAFSTQVVDAGKSEETTVKTNGGPSFIKTFRAKIVPERIRTYTMPTDGVIENWVQNGGRLKKDDLFATINKEELENERNELEVKILRDRVTKQEEITKLEKQLEEVKFYSSLTKKEKSYSSYKQDTGKKAVQNLKDKLELAKKELAILGKKQQSDFRRKEEKYILKMPFDGRIQYQISFPSDGSKSMFLDASALIATVCDDSAYYLTISLGDPDLTRLAPEAFSLVVKMSNGSTLRGDYSFKRVEKNSSNGGDLLAYFFKLPAECHERAHAMLGSNCTAQLYYNPAEDVIRLNKLKLASRPEGRECSSWQELLEKVHPEYELIVNGETELIVRKK